MTDIDIFYQGEHSREIDVIEAGLAETLGDLKRRLAVRHAILAEALIFVEDGEDPLDETVVIETIVVGESAKLHLHRCRRVKVTVAFAGARKEHEFAPSATVARVKTWAADAFGLSPDDAGEHVLQSAGTHDRPSPATHVGALARDCKVAFDLVPDERVNGASDPAGR
ncbi:MAG TPA: hypothetical protein VG248_08235 [Caulobacteraceae bacterium]|jgi:hypothetical protein|nr:hypothetical protein [Caulobacteraceae bacterium]